MSCGLLELRDSLQDRLLAENAGWDLAAVETAPDGDAEISPEAVAAFSVPTCLRCGGILRPRVETAWKMLAEAEVLLVVGSSLAVFSGFRFVEKAAREHKPIGQSNTSMSVRCGSATSTGMLFLQISFVPNNLLSGIWWVRKVMLASFWIARRWGCSMARAQGSSGIVSGDTDQDVDASLAPLEPAFAFQPQQDLSSATIPTTNAVRYCAANGYM
jgi:hypothetical protein